jgi:hypothetical protein
MRWSDYEGVDSPAYKCVNLLTFEWWHHGTRQVFIYLFKCNQIVGETYLIKFNQIAGETLMSVSDISAL